MKRILSLLVVAALVVPAAASAQFAAGVHAGTLGLGVSATLGLSPRINARGAFGVIPGEPEFDIDDVGFAIDFPPLFRATLDFYPTGFFYLSGGALFVGSGGEIVGVGTPTGTVEIGGVPYPAADVGTLDGTITLSSAMPYLGIGFGNPLGGKIGLQFDLGVGLGGTPTIDLGATGLLGNDPDFLNDLAAEETEIQDEHMDWFQYYPVLSLALSIGLGG